MSEERVFIDLATEIKATGRAILRAQKALLAQANDITTLCELAEKVLARLRDEAPGSNARAQATSLVDSISNIELLTKSQASSVGLIATRLCSVARKVQELSAGFTLTASRGNNVVPFRRSSAGDRRALLIDREVDKSRQELRTIRESAREQGALTRVTRDRLRSVRLYLEAFTVTHEAPPHVSDPARLAVP